MAGDEFDPFKLIKKILGKPDDTKTSSQSKPADPPAVQPQVKVAESAPPKSPKLRLLDGLEGMPDRQRLQRMVELGQIAAGGTEEAHEARPLIEELAGGTFYERRLALFAWMGAKDHAKVFEARLDRSHILRKLAVDTARLICTDEELSVMADEKRGVELRRFLLRLYKQRKTTLLDAWLIRNAESRAAEMGQLLAFGSEDFVRERLPLLADSMDESDFARVARRHPVVVADYFLDYATKMRKEDPRFTWLFHSVEKKLAETLPEKTLEIVRTASKVTAVSPHWITRLIHRRPADVVALLLERDALKLMEPLQVVHKLPVELILQVFERKDFSGTAWLWLEKLKPEERDLVFERTGRSWRRESGETDASLVKCLTAKCRIPEARRNLALPSIAGSRAKLPYAALLPSDEIMAHFLPYTNDPDVTIRSTAFGILISSADYNRKDFTSLLQLIEPKSNEPDPVRASFFAAFRELSPAIWKPEHLKLLDVIIRHALNASDLSYQTMYSICALCTGMMPFHPDWACAAIAKLLAERGTPAAYVTLPGVEEFRKADAKILEAALLESLKSWSSKERENRILAIARSFRRRLDVCDHLCEHLAEIAKSAASDKDARDAADLLYTWRLDRFSTLVPELLALDKTWGLTEPIKTFLNRYRQDLLTPYLGQHAYQGRFSTGKTRVVPAFVNGFHRWTTNQQKIYGNELEQLAANPKSDVGEVYFATYRLALLPEPPLKEMARLARRDNENLAVRDNVIQMLARVDGKQGLPILLECLEDDRARVAIYALRQLLLSMPQPEAIAILKRVQSKSITVQKEVARLIGDVGGREAFDLLISMVQRETNRDLKAAMVRALWGYTEESAEVWDVLEKAVESADRVVASAAVRVPYNRLSSESKTRLLKLLARAISHSSEDLRIEALSRMIEIPLVDAERIMLKPIQSKLLSESPTERALASDVLLSRYAPDDEQVAEQAILSLLYHRRHLVDFIGRLEHVQRLQPERLIGVTRATLRAMWTDPLSTELQLRIAFSGLPQADLGKFLLSLDKASRLHSGAVQIAVHACAGGETRMGSEDMDKLERILFNKSSESLRRIGLALLVALGESAQGWTFDRLYRLNSYRKDTSLMIQSAAEFTFPAEEIAPA
ncbi:MAG: hypothetical protein K2W95_24215 [Candidatus Obscuribacterales bacterium]|nr:hypothetical protein [Candidatus Obscuribacterales bacterium]